MKFVRTLFMMMCCVAAPAIAGPTTGPTTAPGTQPSRPKSSMTDRDSKPYVSKELGFQFRAPKTWKAVQEVPATGRFEFDMNADDPGARNPSKRKDKSNPYTPAVGLFEVIGGKPCHGDATLASQGEADDRRSAGIAWPEAKVISDKPATLGGQPAHLIVMETTSTMTIIESSGKQQEKELKSQEHHMLCVRNGLGYDIYLKQRQRGTFQEHAVVSEGARFVRVDRTVEACGHDGEEELRNVADDGLDSNTYSAVGVHCDRGASGRDGHGRVPDSAGTKSRIVGAGPDRAERVGPGLRDHPFLKGQEDVRPRPADG
jgi:hypothetical protein